MGYTIQTLGAAPFHGGQTSHRAPVHTAFHSIAHNASAFRSRPLNFRGNFYRGAFHPSAFHPNAFRNAFGARAAYWHNLHQQLRQQLAAEQSQGGGYGGGSGGGSGSGGGDSSPDSGSDSRIAQLEQQLQQIEQQLQAQQGAGAAQPAASATGQEEEAKPGMNDWRESRWNNRFEAGRRNFERFRPAAFDFGHAGLWWNPFTRRWEHRHRW